MVKYENKDDALENFESQTKIMLANPKSREREEGNMVMDCEIFSVEFQNDHMPTLITNEEGDIQSSQLNQLHMDYESVKGAVVLKDPSYGDK